jgi:hypothetical protein
MENNLNTESVIMVQVSNREWTMEALHCACLLARKLSTKIVLVAMIPVAYPCWLGTEWGYINFTEQERLDLVDYQATIEDYGIAYETVLFQYESLTAAIVQIAEHINAQIVFAQLTESIFPFWTRLQHRLLARQLAYQKRRWIQQPIYNLSAPEIVEVVSEINNLTEHSIP